MIRVTIYKEKENTVVIGWYLDLLLSALPCTGIVAAFFVACFLFGTDFPQDLDSFVQVSSKKQKQYYKTKNKAIYETSGTTYLSNRWSRLDKTADLCIPLIAVVIKKICFIYLWL